MEFPKGFIRSAVHDLKTWADVNVTEQQVIDALNAWDEEKYFKEEFKEVDYDAERTGGLDTAVRDVVFEAVSQYHLDVSWPTISDSEESKKDFTEKLTEKFD